MKIVYMGTPDFAVGPLAAIAEAGYEIGYAVTQQDKARNRGKKIQFTPVKTKAMELDIPVLQPERVKGDEEFLKTLEEYAPDVIVVAAYGQILPEEVLTLPKYGCINIHASLLPRHRGAAPIQRAILCGDEKTGVTIMQMEKGLDTGDMLLKKRLTLKDPNVSPNLKAGLLLSIAGIYFHTSSKRVLQSKNHPSARQQNAMPKSVPLLGMAFYFLYFLLIFSLFYYSYGNKRNHGKYSRRNKYSENPACAVKRDILYTACSVIEFLNRFINSRNRGNA